MTLRVQLVLVLVALTLSGAAAAAPEPYPYDGVWDLTFFTQQGACDPSYNFTVDVRSGVVSNPNFLKLRGRVARDGKAQASVAIGERYAAGFGRLSGSSGGGRWSGRSGVARCSGHWQARKTN